MILVIINYQRLLMQKIRTLQIVEKNTQIIVIFQQQEKNGFFFCSFGNFLCDESGAPVVISFYFLPFQKIMIEFWLLFLSKYCNRY
jgi:hypothetical protein